MTDASAVSGAPEPLLRVVGTDATPEEVAAIVAVLASLGGGPAAPPEPPAEWNAPHRLTRAPLAPGPRGWRSSALPR